MPGYKTLDVLCSERDTSGRIPVEVHVEKQQRVRDDESTTRPFIKLRLVIGNRVVFCDIQQATALAELIQTILPEAEDALEKLLSIQNNSSSEDSASDRQSPAEEPTAEFKRRRRVRRSDSDRYKGNEY